MLSCPRQFRLAGLAGLGRLRFGSRRFCLGLRLGGLLRALLVDAGFFVAFLADMVVLPSVVLLRHRDDRDASGTVSYLDGRRTSSAEEAEFQYFRCGKRQEST